MGRERLGSIRKAARLVIAVCGLLSSSLILSTCDLFKVGLGGKVDIELPEVAISSPEADSYLSGTITLAGTVSDDLALAGLTVYLSKDDANYSYSPTISKTNWTLSIPEGSLADGRWKINAVATDSAGKTRSAERYVTLDNTPPLVLVGTPSNYGDASREDFSTPSVSTYIDIEGTAYDAFGVAETEAVKVRILDPADNYAVKAEKTARGTASWAVRFNFSDDASLSDLSSYVYDVIVTDRAGNSSSTYYQSADIWYLLEAAAEANKISTISFPTTEELSLIEDGDAETVTKYGFDAEELTGYRLGGGSAATYADFYYDKSSVNPAITLTNLGGSGNYFAGGSAITGYVSPGANDTKINANSITATFTKINDDSWSYTKTYDDMSATFVGSNLSFLINLEDANHDPFDVGSYRVAIDVKDVSGNEATTASGQFLIDNSVPSISIDPADPGYLSPDAETGVLSVSVTITDDNAVPDDGLGATVSFSDGSQGETPTVTMSASAEGGTSKTFLVTFPTPTNTSLSVYLALTATDITAEESSQPRTTKYTATYQIDAGRPSLLSFDKPLADSAQGLAGALVEISGTAQDDNAVSAVRYWCEGLSESAVEDDQDTWPEAELNLSNNVYSWSAYLDFSSASAGKKTLSVVVEDKAGNRSSVATREFWYDTALPSITSVSYAQGGSYAGLVEDTVLNGGSSGEVSLKIAADDEDDSGSVSIVVERKDLDNASASWEGLEASTTESSVWILPAPATNAEDGEYSIRVTATDQAGRFVQLTRTVLVDTTKPTVSITNPSGTGYVSGSAYEATGGSSDSGAGVGTVYWTVIADGEESPDLASWNTVSTSGSWKATLDLSSLGEGSKILYVRARDVAGNLGEIVSRAFSIDQNQPTVTETNIGVTPTYQKASFTFSGTASDTNALKSLALVKSGSSIKTWDLSGTSYSWSYTVGVDLSDTHPDDGTTSYQITVTDVAGRSTTIERQITVDTKPPVVSFQDPNPAVIEDDGTVRVNGTISLKGTALDENTIQSLLISRDGGNTWEESDTNYSFSLSINTTELTDNSDYTITVQATDIAGNVTTGSSTMRIDQSSDLPTIEFTNADPENEAVANLFKDYTELAGIAEDDDGAVSAVEIAFDDKVDTPSAYVSVSSAPSGSSGSFRHALDSLSAGLHTLKVRATDVNGKSAYSDLLSFYIDRDLPKAAVTSPSAGAYVNDSFTISGTASDANGLATAAVNGSTVPYVEVETSGDWVKVDATGGTWSYALPSSFITGSPDGSRTVHLRAYDIFGRAIESVVEYKFYVDRTPPTVGVTNPANDGVWKEGTFTVSGSVEDASSGTAKVYLWFGKDGTTVPADLSSWTAVTPSNDAWSLSVASASSPYSEGKWVLYVRAQDAAGNVTISDNAAVREFGIDQSAPTVTETELGSTATQYKGGSFTLEGTIGDTNGLAHLTIEVKKDGVSLDPLLVDQDESGTSLDYTTDFTPSGDGQYVFTVTATDLATRTTSITRTVVVDRTAPEVAIGYPEVFDADNETLSRGRLSGTMYTASGTSDDHDGGVGVAKIHYWFGSPAAEAGDPSGWSYVQPTDSAGTWDNVYLNLSTAGEGEKVFKVAAEDKAGNVSGIVSRTVMVDQSVPTLNWGPSQAGLSYVTQAVSLSFEGEDTNELKRIDIYRTVGGETLYWYDDELGGATALDRTVTFDVDTSSSHHYDGENQFQVVLWDASNRSVSISRTYIVDTEAPTIAADATNPVLPVVEVSGVSYVNGIVTLKGTALDDNLSSVSYSYAGGSGTASNPASWSIPVDTTKISASGGAVTGTVSLTAMDKAENKTTLLIALNVWQDSDLPTISLGGVDESLTAAAEPYSDEGRRVLTDGSYIAYNVFNSSNKTMTITVDDDDLVDGTKIQISVDSGLGSQTWTSLAAKTDATSITTSYNVYDNLSAGLHWIWVQAYDDASAKNGAGAVASEAKLVYVAVNKDVPSYSTTPYISERTNTVAGLERDESFSAASGSGWYVAEGFTLSGKAIDAELSKVMVTVGSNTSAADLESDGSFSYTADVSGISEGDYDIEVVAYDSYGEEKSWVLSNAQQSFLHVKRSGPTLGAVTSPSLIDSSSTQATSIEQNGTVTLSTSFTDSYKTGAGYFTLASGLGPQTLSDAETWVAGSTTLQADIWYKVPNATELTTYSFSASLDTTKLEDGTYYLYIGAEDGLGNQSMTASPYAFVVNQSSDYPVIGFTNADASLEAADNLFDSGGIIKGTITDDDAVKVETIQVSYDGGAYVNVTLRSTTNTQDAYFRYDVSTVEEGEHTLRIKAFDIYGVSAESDILSFAVDKAPPTVTITPPASTYFKDTLSLSGTSSDGNSVASVWYSLDGTNYAEVSSSWNDETKTGSWAITNAALGSAEGTKTVYVKAIDAYSKSGVSTTSITVDQTAPETSFILPETGTTVNGLLAVKGTTDDENQVSSVSLKVGSSDWEILTGQTYSWSKNINTTTLDGGNPYNGSLAIQVKATDAAGNTSDAVTVTVTVNQSDDLPVISLVNMDADNDTEAEASGNLQESNAKLVGTVSDDDGLDLTTLKVSVDGGEYALAGTISGSGTYASFEQSLSGYSEGPHYLNVKVSDKSSLKSDLAAVESTVGPVYFVIDKTPPTVTITPPDNIYFTNTLSLSGTSADGNSVASVWYSLDGTNYTEVSSSWNDGTKTGSWSITGAALGSAEGSKTVYVKAIDAYSKDGVSTTSIIVDQTLPVVEFTSVSPLVDDTKVNGLVTVRGSVTESNPLKSVGYKIGGAYDEGSYTDVTSSLASWNFSFTSNDYDDGTVKIWVQAVDQAGNYGYESYEVEIDQDSDYPVITTLSMDQDVTDLEDAGTNLLDSGAKLIASVEDDDWVNKDSIKLLIDKLPSEVEDSDWVSANPSASSSTYLTFEYSLTSLSEGPHSIAIRASDQSDKKGGLDIVTTVTDPIYFVVDKAPPTVTISTPSSAYYKNSLSLNGSFTDGNGVSEVRYGYDGSTYALLATLSTSDGGKTGTWSFSGADISDLEEGSNTIYVKAIDKYAKSTVSEVSITVDRLGPTVSISAPLEGATVNGSIAFSGTTKDEEAYGTTYYYLATPTETPPEDIGQWISLSGTASSTKLFNWSLSSFDTTLKDDGTYELYFRGYDAAGNTTTTSVTITIDQTTDIPVVSLSGIDASKTARENLLGANPIISGTIVDDDAVLASSIQISFNGTDWLTPSSAPLSNGASLSFSHTLTTAQAAEGVDHAFYVKATDIYGKPVDQITVSGNLYDYAAYRVDASNPTVTISTPAQNSYAGDSITVTGASSDGSIVSSIAVSIDGGESYSTEGVTYTATQGGGSWSWTGSIESLGETSVTLKFKALDEFDKDGYGNLVVIHDSEAPEVTFNQPATEGEEINGLYTFKGTSSDTNTISSSKYWIGTALQEAPASDSEWLAVSGTQYVWTVAVPTSTTLDEGSYKFWIRAKDGAGNKTDQSIAFEVDQSSDAPVVSFTTPTEDYSYTNRPITATGIVTDDDGLASLKYKLPGDIGWTTIQTWSSSYPTSYSWSVDLSSLSDGTGKTFDIQATDYLGATEYYQSETTSPSFSITTQSPEVAITSPTIEDYFAGDATINVTGTASDPDGNVTKLEYALDGSTDWQDITADLSGTGFDTDITVPAEKTDGILKIKIRATDNSSKTGMATVEVYVDETVPTVSAITVTSLLTGSKVNGSITMSGTASDTAALDYVTLRIQGTLADETAYDQTTTFSDDHGAVWSKADFDTTVFKDDTSLTLTATSYDKAGNPSVAATKTITVDQDTDTPSITYTNLAKNGSTYFFSSGSILGSITDDDGVDKIAYSIDGATPWTEVELGNGTTESFDISYASLCDGAHDGPHTVQLTAYDTVGNAKGTLADASISFRIDTKAPTLAFTEPAANSYQNNDFTVKGTSTDENGIKKVEYSVNGGDYVDASSFNPSTYDWEAAVTASSSRTFTISVRVTDNGNREASDTRQFYVDIAKPTVGFSSPSSGTTVNGTIALSGTASDSETSVGSVHLYLVLPGGGTSEISGVSNTTSWSLASFKTTDYDDADHAVLQSGGDHDGAYLITLRAVATDAADNDSDAVDLSFYVDQRTDAPTAEITAPTEGEYVEANAIVQGTLTDDDGINTSSVAVSLDGGSTWVNETNDVDGTITTPGNLIVSGSGTTVTFRYVLPDGLDEGNTSVMVRVKDTVTDNDAETGEGDDGIVSETVNFVLDTTPPAVSFDNPEVNDYFNGRVDADGDIYELNGLSSLTVKLDGTELSGATIGGTAPNYTWSIEILASSISGEGSHTITLIAEDDSGKTGQTTRDFIYDTEAPTISPINPEAGTSLNGKVVLQGTTSDNYALKLTSYKMGLDSAGYTDFSQAVAWSKTFNPIDTYATKSYARDQGDTDLDGVQDEDETWVNIWNLTIHIHAEDQAGNAADYDLAVVLDPGQDLPTADIAQPFYTETAATELVAGRSYLVSSLGSTDFTSVGADSNTVGAFFSASGPATGTGLANEVPTLAGVIRVAGTAYDDDGLKRVEMAFDMNNDGDFDDAGDVWPSATGFDPEPLSQVSSPSAEDETFTDAATTAWYTTTASASGWTNWYSNLNAYGEFDPASGTTKTFRIKVRAIDKKDGVIGVAGTATVFVLTVDASVPRIEDLYWDSGESADNNDTIGGTPTLSVKVRDESGIDTIRLIYESPKPASNKVTLVSNGSVVQWASDEGTIEGLREYTLTIPIDTTASWAYPDYGTGTMTFSIEAVDDSGYTTQLRLSVLVDNCPPTSTYVSDPEDDDDDLTVTVGGTTYHNLIGSAMHLSGVWTDSGSVTGFDRIEAYLVRDVSGTRYVYNPLTGDSMELTTTEDFFSYNGSTYSSVTPYYPEPTETDSDYRIKINKVTSNSSGEIANGYLQQVKESGQWWVEMTTANIDDGPIELHYVVFDSAGNGTHYVVNAFITNHRPAILGLTLGTDLNGDGDNGDSGEVSSTPYTDYSTGFTVRNNRLYFAPSVSSPVNEPLSYSFSYDSDHDGVGDRELMSTVAAGGFVSGLTYMIKEPGSTNFVAIGAADNAIGTIFTATGAGSGDGTAYLLTTTHFTNIAEALSNGAWFILTVTDAVDMSDSVTVKMNVDNVDEIAPSLAEIDPISWNSEDDNSIYEHDREQGHVEPVSVVGTDNEVPDVSGKITLTGRAFDDQRIQYIRMKITGFDFNASGTSPAAGEWFTVASWNGTTLAGSDGWDDYGWKFTTATGNAPTQSGHSVEFSFDWDSSYISGVAAENVVINLQVQDARNVDTDAADIDNYLNADSLTVDVVPYIKAITNPTNEGLKDAVLRSSSGKYSIDYNSSNVFYVKGFNLGSSSVSPVLRISSAVISSASDGTGLSASYNSTENRIEVSKNISQSGYLTLFVGGMPCPNNISEENDKAYQQEADAAKVYSGQWTDDRYLWVWNTTQVLSSVTNQTFYYPDMYMSGTQPIFSYCNDNDGYTYRTIADNTTSKKAGLWYERQTALAYADSSYWILSVEDAFSGDNIGFLQLNKDQSNTQAAVTYVTNNNLFELVGEDYGSRQLNRFRYPKLLAETSSTNDADIYIAYYDAQADHKDLTFLAMRASGVKTSNFTQATWPTTRGSPVTVLSGTAGGNCSEYFDLVKVGTSDIAVVYYDATAGTLKMQYSSDAFTSANLTNTSATWTTKDLDEAEFSGSHVSVTTDGTYLYIAYYDSADANLKFLRVNWSDKSVSGPYVIDSYLSVGTWTNITLINGLPVISYYSDSYNGTKQPVRIAWPTSSANVTSHGVLEDGASEAYSGNWEVMTIPAASVPKGGMEQFNHTQIGVYTNSSQALPVVGWLADKLEYAKLQPYN